MSEVLASAWQGLLGSSPWELAAMLLSVAYLILAVRQNIWCWAAAFFGTAIYMAVFLNARLYMDSGLQVFYMLMAVYGWRQWRHHPDQGEDLRISVRSARWHLLVIAVVLAAAALSGAILEEVTSAAFPYLDSLTTWASVITTWMVARKILENWVYWIVIDSVSIYIYLDRGLYLTVFLFLLYTVIAIFGWQQWQKNRLEGQ